MISNSPLHLHLPPPFQTIPAVALCALASPQTLAENVGGLWYQESATAEPVFVPVVDLLRSPHYTMAFEESAESETRLFATNPKEQLAR